MIGEARLANVNLVARSKAGQVLNGFLLPKRSSANDALAFVQLNNIYTCAINDDNGQTIALAAVIKFTPDQAYCFLSQVNEDLQAKLLDVKAVNTHNGRHMEIQLASPAQTADREDAADIDDPRHRIYRLHTGAERRTPIECILEAVVEAAFLGARNLELTKNVTIDLASSQLLAADAGALTLWRDRLGFCVADRHEFVEAAFLGARNLELTKNVTIDLASSQLLAADAGALTLWRDQLGFCVADRHEFVEITVGAADLLAAVEAEEDGAGRPRRRVLIKSGALLVGGEDASPITVDVGTVAQLHAYDQKVTQLQRGDYLSFLRRLTGASQRVAHRHSGASSVCCGCVLTLGATVLSLYADDRAVAVALLRDRLAALCRPQTAPEVTLTVVRDGALDRLLTANGRRRDIRRFHTTAPPAHIAWRNVYVANVGMHLV